MKYFLFVPIVVAVILVVADPVFGGGIRGTNNQNSVQDKNDNGLVISREEVRRILDEEEQGPIVSEDCADTIGMIEVSAEATSNCRKIKKNRLCEREHNGKHLYESCQKSCGICVEPIPTTDAPTADLVGLVITDMPTDESYRSLSPSQYPTSTVTEPPTESPSHYPTNSPTTLVPISIIAGNETAEPTYEAVLGEGFDSTVDPANYQSASPSLTPTTKFTDEPTEAPSPYPTPSPTENQFVQLIENLDDDALKSVFGNLQ